MAGNAAETWGAVAVKLCQAEYAAQKARKKAEAKARKEAERKRVAEGKKKKKRILEYLQQLWNEVLAECTKGSQITGSKCTKVTSGNKEGQWPFKKAKEKQ